MTEQTEQTTEPITAQPDAVPARIALEDVVEAVTRGVARALVTADDVSGYALTAEHAPPVLGRPLIVVGVGLPWPSGPFVPREVPVRR